MLAEDVTGSMEDLPDPDHVRDPDLAAAAASLDVQAYLQRDADAVFESAFLSLRSDIARDPRSAGYDMSIPPANHREAMMRSDVEEWKKVEDKELEMLKTMGVYVDEPLPEGRKAIGNRWVFEFKMDTNGGPPIYKARLVAQGFSQVPFVDYDATFAPVAKSASVQFVAVHSALHSSLFTVGIWNALMPQGPSYGVISLVPSTCATHLDTCPPRQAEAFGAC